MKKTRVTICVALFVLILCLFGCKCRDGEHDYKENVIKEATCEKKGEVEYVCSICGDTYREDIEALEHEFDSVKTAASCVSKSEVTYTCKRCGYTYKEEGEVDKSAHEFDEGTVVAQASCVSDGKVVYKCKLCGEEKSEVAPATGHDYRSTVTAATCTADGAEVFVCSRCYDTYTEVIPATGHDWEEAACLNPKTCRNCGLTEGAMLGHTVYGGVCGRCGKTTDTTEVISLTGIGNRIYDNKGGFATVTNMYMSYEYIYQRGYCGTANLFFDLDTSNAKTEMILINIYLTDAITGKVYGPLRQGCLRSNGTTSFYVGYEQFAGASPGLYSVRLESLDQAFIDSHPELWG